MLRHTFTRTVLGAVLTAVLLAPAAHADDWARDGRIGLDPAIATALQDHTTQLPASLPLDTAIAVAVSDRSSADQLALDPAIRTALIDRASSATRPDDQAEARGVGSLPQPVETVSGGFDWDRVGIGAGATFAALLLALGSMLALQAAADRSHERVRTASSSAGRAYVARPRSS